MNEVQRNYILATQGESLRKKYDLDQIIDLSEIEEPDGCFITQGPGTYTVNRVYGTKDDKLVRVKMFDGGGHLEETMERHPYLQVSRDVGRYFLFNGGLCGLGYLYAEGASLLPNTPDNLADQLKTVLGSCLLIANGMTALTFLPSDIRNLIYETRIWNKFKSRKVTD